MASTRIKKKTPNRNERAAKTTRAASNSTNAVYRVYAVATDGRRRHVQARELVIDLGEHRLTIDLVRAAVRPSGRITVTVEGSALLVLGPGCGNSVELGVDADGKRLGGS